MSIYYYTKRSPEEEPSSSDQEKKKPKPPEPHPRPDDEEWSCFAGDSEVITPSGKKAMATVGPGDFLLSLDQQGTLSFSQVWMNAHEEPEAQIRLVQLDLQDRSLKLSPGHYVIVVRQDGSMTHARARDVTPGDVMLVASGTGGAPRRQAVVEVSECQGKGKFAPLTCAGNLVVNDVIASCYEETVTPRMAHLLTSPLRLVHRLTPTALEQVNKLRSWFGVPTWAVWCVRNVLPYLPTQRFA